MPVEPVSAVSGLCSSHPPLTRWPLLPLVRHNPKPSSQPDRNRLSPHRVITSNLARAGTPDHPGTLARTGTRACSASAQSTPQSPAPVSRRQNLCVSRLQRPPYDISRAGVTAGSGTKREAATQTSRRPATDGKAAAATVGAAIAQPAEPTTTRSEASSAPQTIPADLSVLVAWNTLFSAWRWSRKTSPEFAAQRNEQGDVALCFTVAGDGTVLEVSPVTGGAVRCLIRPLPALPRNAKPPRLQAEISRTIRLQNRLEAEPRQRAWNSRERALAMRAAFEEWQPRLKP